MNQIHVVENLDEETPILHFSLQGLLKEEQSIAIDMDNGFLALLFCNEGHVRMVKTLEFPPGERSVLLPILESYPYYCPYEVLGASLNGRATTPAIVRWQKRLQEASLEGVWDQEMRPLRNVISRIRLKTREIGIDIVSILETGYTLSQAKRR